MVGARVAPTPSNGQTEAEAALAALPTDSDRLVRFDANRARVASLGDEMSEMTREQIAEVFSDMVERVDTRDQRVIGVTLLAEWRALFDAAMLGPMAPPDGLAGLETNANDPDCLPAGATNGSHAHRAGSDRRSQTGRRRS